MPISREVYKSNQAMKFGQSIDYDMRNIFIENSYLKYGGETSSRPLSEKLKFSISLDLRFIESAFIVCQVEGYKI